ncbi:MAG: hypothetical protein OEY87_01780 [Gammaproteobacteria bacterium]|nr:hypothetical protein [Gammaproteobacteria bacterium]
MTVAHSVNAKLATKMQPVDDAWNRSSNKVIPSIKTDEGYLSINPATEGTTFTSDQDA